MKILASDTSTDHAVFVVADELGNELASHVFPHHRDLSRQYYEALAICLKESGAAFEDIDAFAVGIGPGSFTGVRVAVSTFRTFAQITGKPLIGIPTTDPIAYAAATRFSVAKILVVLPSRRNELYASWYSGDAHALGTPFVTPQATLGDLIRGEVRSDEHASSILVAGRIDLVPEEAGEFPRLFLDFPPAQSLGWLAARAHSRREFSDPFSLDPLYIAPPAISQHKQAAGPAG